MKVTRKVFNPKKYRMTFCPYCNGSGRIRNKEGKREVCAYCGGFGLRKTDEKPYKRNRFSGLGAVLIFL